MLISPPAWKLLKVHCKVFFNWFYFYYWYNLRRHSKNSQREFFFRATAVIDIAVTVYTENYKGCKISPFYEKAQKSTVQFYIYVRHKAKLNVYSLVCSNLSQRISPKRKHYFKYVCAFTKKKKCRQNRVQIACLFLNNRFVHFASEIDTNFSNISWY